MDLNTISGSKGWYLAEVTGSLRSSESIIVTDIDSFKKYNFKLGSSVEVQKVDDGNSSGQFIILPYDKDYNKAYIRLKKVLEKCKEQKKIYKINEEYYKRLENLTASFYKCNKSAKSLWFDELFLSKNEKKSTMGSFGIGLPEFWLNCHNVGLGEKMLLRNDNPSNKIYKRNA